VKVRAFIYDGRYTDTEWSMPMMTAYDPWWYGYAVIGIVALGIIVLMVIVCWRCWCAESQQTSQDDTNKQQHDNPVYMRDKPSYQMRNGVTRLTNENVLVTTASSRPREMTRVYEDTNGVTNRAYVRAEESVHHHRPKFEDRVYKPRSGRSTSSHYVHSADDSRYISREDGVYLREGEVNERGQQTNSKSRPINHFTGSSQKIVVVPQPTRYIQTVDDSQYIQKSNNTHVRREAIVKRKEPIYLFRHPRPRSSNQKVIVTEKTPQRRIFNTYPISHKLSRPVLIEAFAEHYRQLAADSEYRFQEEYDDLRSIGTNYSSLIGERAENRLKNRYTNILPYDHTRVKLIEMNEDDEEDIGSTYINANYISGYTSPREYIATQGPLPTTKDDFWRMIWEQNTQTIVMITRCVEKGKVRCDHYWPFDSDPTEYGDITITMASESVLPEWTVRDFTLELKREVRSLRHFQFTAWPDHGALGRTDLLLRFVRTVRGQIPRNAGPTIVHCSAGVGRSGTFVAFDFVLQHLARKENKFIDIFGVVARMRQQRCYMVQTEAQYVFIHKAVLDVLEGRVSDSNWLLTPSL
ncbi:uncharacterized protein LOC100375587, partial [Saccoglossus kowalevskii]